MAREPHTAEDKLCIQPALRRLNGVGGQARPGDHGEAQRESRSPASVGRNHLDLFMTRGLRPSRVIDPAPTENTIGPGTYESKKERRSYTVFLAVLKSDSTNS